MLIKEVVNFLYNNELDTGKELCVMDGTQLDKVVDIYIDENNGNLVFYIGEQYGYLKPYFIKDLITMINTSQFNLNNKILIDCNEYISVSEMYICNNTKNLIFVLSHN